MPRIRPFQPGDEPGLPDVCIRTADGSGGDGRGLFHDAALLGDVLAVPYAARHPELASVIVNDDDRVIGYIVGTPDTDAFEAWFAREWWPSVSNQYPAERAEGMDGHIIGYAAARGRGGSMARVPIEEEYPAHLHIDLLPEAQNGGFGRQLIETLSTALAAAGVIGVHALVARTNEKAMPFWTKVGFTEVHSDDLLVGFGRKLSSS
jgi:GNAT superfamily N-acetyltransferase